MAVNPDLINSEYCHKSFGELPTYFPMSLYRNTCLHTLLLNAEITLICDTWSIENGCSNS